MDEFAIYKLMMDYPGLTDFIKGCIEERNMDKLFDFIINIELSDEIYFAGVHG